MLLKNGGIKSHLEIMGDFVRDSMKDAAFFDGIK